MKQNKLQTLKKVGQTALVSVALSCAFMGLIIVEYSQYQTKQAWKKDIKYIPALINFSIEENLKNQGLTGGIYESMKSIEALGGECGRIAKDLRQDYNGRVAAVYTRAQKTVMPSSAGEGGVVYPYHIKERIAQTTDFLMTKYAGDLEQYENPPIPESTPEKFKEMIINLKTKALFLEACVARQKT